MEVKDDNISFFINDEIISKCEKTSLVKIIPGIEEITYQKGYEIYKKGDYASNFYIIVEGKIRLKGSYISVEIKKGHFGNEAGANIETYLSNAVTLTETKLLVIHKNSIMELLKANPKIETNFLHRLLKRFGIEKYSQLAGKEDKLESEVDKLKIQIIIGWILTILVPIGILFFGYQQKIPITLVLFLTILSATVLMWIFNLVAEFIPGLFAVLSVLILGLVPVKVALSGFASEGFFMAMSILGLGSVIVSSGLSYRLILIILKIVPNNQFFHNLGLLLSGILITPVLPTINGRVSLIAPLYIDLIDSVKLQPNKKAATRLAITAFTGTTLLSAVFLSSKSVNFIIFGLLPLQVQSQFQWVGWLIAASVTGLAALIFYFLTISILYWNKEKPTISKEQINIQLKTLGKMNVREWAAIIGFVVFTISVVTSSIHKIAPSWLGLCLLYILLLFGVLPKEDFKTKIDWPFLMFLGGMTSAVTVMNYLGIDKIIAGQLAWMGNYMSNNFMLFILVLTLTISIIRLFLPISVTIVISATVFIPIASVSGINEWLIGFIILIIGEMWFFPYQCSYYLQFREILSEKNLYDEKSFLRYNALMNVFKILAIYVSIPFWKMIGVL